MKLNKKGYMLVEIVVAAVLAFGIAFYLLNLTYDFKNKDEDIYQSILYSNDKVAVTKNIMNDLDSGSVIAINDPVVDENDETGEKKIEVDFSLRIDSVTENRRIKIDQKKTGTTIYYGKWNGTSFDQTHVSYYEKTLQKSLVVGKVEISVDESKEYLTLVIPISSLYEDRNYDIKLFVRCNPEPILQSVSSGYTGEFWNYKSSITNIVFQNEMSSVEGAVDSWDVSSLKNKTVMAYLVPNVENTSTYTVYIQGKNGVIANMTSSNLFSDFTVLENIEGLEYFDTSNAVYMNYMFSKCKSLKNLNLSNFNTLNVTRMNSMFSGCSSLANLDLSNFDTSNVTDMGMMFDETGKDSTVFTLNLGEKFDTSNVTDMGMMFDETGKDSTVFTLDLGEKFDTSNVTDMNYMFYLTGRNSTEFTLDLGDKFDTSSVTGMYAMFYEAGYSSTVFTLDLGEKFDTSNVTDMNGMFSFTGYSNPNFMLDLGEKFNTSNVTDMKEMFWCVGNANSNLELDLSAFDFGNVTSYDDMFSGFSSTQKIYVKDTDDQVWILDKGFANLSEGNVLIKS